MLFCPTLPTLTDLFFSGKMIFLFSQLFSNSQIVAPHLNDPWRPWGRSQGLVKGTVEKSVRFCVVPPGFDLGYDFANIFYSRFKVHCRLTTDLRMKRRGISRLCISVFALFYSFMGSKYPNAFYMAIQKQWPYKVQLPSQSTQPSQSSLQSYETCSYLTTTPPHSPLGFRDDHHETGHPENIIPRHTEHRNVLLEPGKQ